MPLPFFFCLSLPFWLIFYTAQVFSHLEYCLQFSASITVPTIRLLSSISFQAIHLLKWKRIWSSPFFLLDLLSEGVSESHQLLESRISHCYGWSFLNSLALFVSVLVILMSPESLPEVFHRSSAISSLITGCSTLNWLTDLSHAKLYLGYAFTNLHIHYSLRGFSWLSVPGLH